MSSVIETFTIKRGDTSPTLQYELSPTPNLTGATVVLNMKTTSGTATITRAAVDVVGDATDGIVEYEWISADTDTVGVYNAEFEVTYSNGKIETFPNDGYIRVKVYADLG